MLQTNWLDPYQSNLLRQGVPVWCVERMIDDVTNHMLDIDADEPELVLESSSEQLEGMLFLKR